VGLARLQVCAGAALMALSSCAVGPDFVRPTAPENARYTEGETPTATVSAAGQAQSFQEGRKVAAAFWQLLDCPALDGLVAETLEHNPSLEAARANLRQSQHLLRAGYGVFFPAVDASAGLSVQRSNPIGSGVSVPASTYGLGTASVNVSYTLDIWGGERRAIEGLAAQVEAQRFTLIGAYLALVGNAVNAVIARAAYRAQIEATRALLTLEEDQLRITRVQASAGTVPYANVLSVESQLASTEATLPLLQAKVDQAEHLLAALAGRSPGEGAPPPIALADLKLPREVPLSLPSELVRQRPDILLAEAQLHSASANIGVATAAQLPSLTLSGGVGVASNFSAAAPFWSAGAGLLAPLFRGGALYYQRRAAIDAFDGTRALYRQAVLGAFQQVADTLRALQHDAETLRAQAHAVDAAERALKLTHFNYDAGIATYLQVLVADGQYLQARLSYIQAVAQRLQDTVALYLALGGGWWNAPRPIAAG
jgi:NodT family efflux transporter outer membrane factor (OMF) lipoprotein